MTTNPLRQSFIKYAYKLAQWNHQKLHQIKKICEKNATHEKLEVWYVTLTVKHGGVSFMAWGCFVGEKVGDLKREQDHLIVKKHAIPSGLKNNGKKITFPQDSTKLFPKLWLGCLNLQIFSIEL